MGKTVTTYLIDGDLKLFYGNDIDERSISVHKLLK